METEAKKEPYAAKISEEQIKSPPLQQSKTSIDEYREFVIYSYNARVSHFIDRPTDALEITSALDLSKSEQYPRHRY
jgi:hypothetical protein